MLRWFVVGSAMLGLVLSVPVSQAADKAAKPWLGVMVGPAEKGTDEGGVVVLEITPEGPAAKAGLKQNDWIVKAGDKQVKDVETLMSWLGEQKAGDKVTFQIMRDGKEQEIAVTLGELQLRRLFGKGNLPLENRRAYLGVHSQELTKELKERLKLAADQGAMVTEVMPESPAAKAGLKAEDVIVGVNDRTIASPEELRESISKMEAGKDCTLKIWRGKEKMDIKAQLGHSPVAFDNLHEFLPRFGEGRFNSPDMEGLFREFHNVQDLNKRIQELEKRIRELEQKVNPAAKS